MRDDICLVLPGIQLHPLQNKPPAGLAEAAAQLYRIQRSLRIDLTKRVGIWLPSDADYERLCDAVQLSDAALVSKVITTSIKRSTVSLSDHFSEPPVLPPVRSLVLQARQALLLALNKLPNEVFGTRQIESALSAYLQAEHSEIERLHAAAAAAPNFQASTLLRINAEIMSLLLETSHLVLQAKERIAAGGMATAARTPEESMRLLGQMSSVLIRTAKALAP